MSRNVIYPIPKGIIAARNALNELSREGKINLISKSLTWSEAEIFCSPLKCEVSFSRENIELVLKIRLGRIFDTSAIEELMSEIPIPINYSYTLEPEPELYSIDQLAVTPQTNKTELIAFLNSAITKALMAIQMCLVTDSFNQKSKSSLTESILPQPNQLWDFRDLTGKLLTQHG